MTETPLPAPGSARAPLLALAVVLAGNGLVLLGWVGWIVLTIPRQVEGAGGLVRLSALLVAVAALTVSVLIGAAVVAVRSGRLAQRGGTATAVRFGAAATGIGLAPVVALWLASLLLS